MTITLIGGCSPEAQFADDLNDYRKRLNRVLELEIEKPAVDRLELRPPEPRVLRRDIPRLTVNFWQFLKLSGCELNRAIGEHNSILNRHQGASEALFHDASFVFLAQQCLQQAKDRSASPFPLLERALADKRESLPVRLANATFASQEFANFFSVHTRLHPPKTIAAQASGVATAIDNLVAISAQLAAAVAEPRPTPTASRSNFDKALGLLQTQKFAGQVLAYMHAATIELNTITNAVTIALGTGQICPKANTGDVLLNPGRAVALEYLFREKYLGHIQPSIGAVDKAAQIVQRLGSLTALVGQATPAEFSRYWQSHWSSASDSHFRRYRRAVRQHSSMWQKLLARCDILQLPPIELLPEHDP